MIRIPLILASLGTLALSALIARTGDCASAMALAFTATLWATLAAAAGR